MKKNNLLMTSLVVIAISAMTSCKKDEVTNVITPEPEVVAETNTEKLTGKSFKMTAWTSSPAWKGYTDVYASTLPCYKDNSIMYSSAGTFAIDKGDILDCDSAIATSGTWVFNADETEIIVNGKTTYTVLTNDGMTLSYKTSILDTSVTPNVTLVWTYTFMKQASAPMTNAEKVAGKTYKMTAWTSDPAWKGTTNVLDSTEACYLDNTITYNAGGTFAIDLGAITTCDSSTATSGTYAFSSNGSLLTINGNVNYSLLQNDGTTLKYTVPYTDTTVSPNVSHLWTLTFTKQ